MDITVGLRLPHQLPDGVKSLHDFAAKVEAAGIDRVCTGDHVAFQDGQGFDGLINATAIAVAAQRVTVQTAVYLLPLRHPVLVARQIATLAELAPGRLVFGVGLGGEDPAELGACGVDPATRGRRMDEGLVLLQSLLTGAPVTWHGTFFEVDQVSIRPAPSPAVPIVVGGRSDAALRRVARHGDGWLGLWVSPRRYADATAQVGRYAEEAGRVDVAWQHGMHVWCGFGDAPERAQGRLVTAMESLYRIPFAKFDRYCPCGTPEQIAEALRPYAAAGCRSFNLIPVAENEQAAIDGVGRVRSLLVNLYSVFIQPNCGSAEWPPAVRRVVRREGSLWLLG